MEVRLTMRTAHKFAQLHKERTARRDAEVCRFLKSPSKSSPHCKLSTFSILNAESFHLRWIDIHLGHSVGGCPLAIVAVSFETFKLFSINIAGTLHSRGSISRVNIGPERLSTTLRDVRTHTYGLLIQIDIRFGDSVLKSLASALTIYVEQHDANKRMNK